MAMQWRRDIDAAIGQAKVSNRPLLVDFSAAPDCGGCVRLKAESYGDDEICSLINENFLAVEMHIKDNVAEFHRFDVMWTPTVLVLDPNGVERERSEGYLPKPEFCARLKMGLARIAFMSRQWTDAEQRYAEVVEVHKNTSAAPEAIYWRGVSRYKRTNEPRVLGEIAEQFKRECQDSVWAQKASVWSTK